MATHAYATMQKPHMWPRVATRTLLEFHFCGNPFMGKKLSSSENWCKHEAVMQLNITFMPPYICRNQMNQRAFEHDLVSLLYIDVAIPFHRLISRNDEKYGNLIDGGIILFCWVWNFDWVLCTLDTSQFCHGLSCSRCCHPNVFRWSMHCCKSGLLSKHVLLSGLEAYRLKPNTLDLREGILQHILIYFVHPSFIRFVTFHTLNSQAALAMSRVQIVRRDATPCPSKLLSEWDEKVDLERKDDFWNLMKSIKIIMSVSSF